MVGGGAGNHGAGDGNDLGQINLKEGWGQKTKVNPKRWVPRTVSCIAERQGKGCVQHGVTWDHTVLKFERRMQYMEIATPRPVVRKQHLEAEE